MDIEIRKLTPELVDDYIRFFDVTPHDDYTDASKCYCVGWCNANSDGMDFSSAEKRRKIAVEYVKNGNIQGYLAYDDGKAVGWVNANVKSDCLNCGGWRWLMKSASADEPESNTKVKSVFCFVIAPEMQRKGVAARLLERVCADAARDGFDFVEAYPNKTFADVSADFMGPVGLFKKAGFITHCEADRKFVVRKRLR